MKIMISWVSVGFGVMISSTVPWAELNVFGSRLAASTSWKRLSA